MNSDRACLTRWRTIGLGLLRIAFGAVWAVDAWFKWEPSFINKFAGYLTSAQTDQPAAVRAWIGLWIRTVNVDPHAFAHAVAIGETAVAIGLLLGILSNVTNVIGVLLSLVIWSTAEGFGGPYQPGSTDVGSALIYALVFVALFLTSSGRYVGLDAILGKKLGRWQVLACGAASSAFVAFLLIAGSLPARADTPFQIEDPSVLSAGRWESFTSYEHDHDPGGATWQFPAIELHGGLAPHLMLHLQVQFAGLGAAGAGIAGIGDSTLGLKYQFLRGGGDGIVAAVFPQITLPTAAGGLGNGKSTYEFPLWAQTTRGRWTVCAGGGVDVNPIPGERNAWFSGLLLHENISEKWLAGFEILDRESSSVGQPGSQFLDVGTSYYFNGDFGVTARAGKSAFGSPAGSNFYISIYRAWGSTTGAQ